MAGGKVGMAVCGPGTGGIVSGIAGKLKEQRSSCKVSEQGVWD